MVNVCCLYFATIFEKFFSNLSLCLVNLASVCSACPEEHAREDSAELEGGEESDRPSRGKRGVAHSILHLHNLGRHPG